MAVVLCGELQWAKPPWLVGPPSILTNRGTESLLIDALETECVL